MELYGYLLIALVSGAIIGNLVYQVHKGTLSIKKPSDVLDAFYDAQRLVYTYAPAADQLMKIGQLEDNQAKLDYVMEMVLDYLEDFDPKMLRGIIEAWVRDNHTEDEDAE